MKIDLQKIKYYYLTCNNEVRKRFITNEFKGYDLTEVNPITNIPRYQSGASGFLKMISLGAKNQDRNQPFQPFVVLEDDVKHYREFPKTIEIPEDADILYIGLSLFGLTETHLGIRVGVLNSVKYDNIDSNIARVYNMLSTHGIIICSALGLIMMQKCMLESFNKNLQWDVPLTEAQPHYQVYALKIPLVYQFAEIGGAETSTKIELK